MKNLGRVGIHIFFIFFSGKNLILCNLKGKIIILCILKGILKCIKLYFFQKT